jgi:hypothetical protein
MRKLSAILVLGLAALAIVGCSGPVGHGTATATSETFVPPVAAPKSADPNAADHDEAKALISACGKPLSDFVRTPKAVQSQGLTERTISYQRADFIFMRGPDKLWALTGAFRPDQEDAISKDDVAATMPCIKPLRFANDLFDLR